MLLWESAIGYPSTTTPQINYSYKELRGISRTTALVLMGNFNFLGINWEYHVADTNRSRKFVKHIKDNFLVQVLRELSR